MHTESIWISDAGFEGVFYPVGQKKDKAVITLSGSEGGLRSAKKMAQLHQRQGIPALALACFGTRGTVPSLSRVPLEYAEQAIVWLRRQGYRRIGIEGISKGTEYALAAATTIQELSCVVLRSPSWFYSEGLIRRTPSNTSSWAYRGKELPYTPYRERDLHAVRCILQTKEYNILPVNTGKQVVDASVIPVEKVNGPVLILSTKADTIWPSAESGEILSRRLAQAGFPYPYRHICFTHMSHIMLEDVSRPIRLLFRSERQDSGACAAEREQMRKEVRIWLEAIW